MRAAWFIARKDLSYLLRRRETLMWVFLMPILFIYFIGTVTGGFAFLATDRRDPLAIRGAANGGFLVDELIRHLETQHFAITRTDSPDQFAEFSTRLTIPDPLSPYMDFTSAVLAGQQQVLTVEQSGDSLTGAYDQVRIARAVYEVVADLASVRTAAQPPSPESFARLNAMPRALSLTVRTAGKRIIPPTGFSQAVPGEMVMLTMLVLLTSGAILLVIERDQGLLRRLASTPIPAGSVVFGKWMSRMMLGLGQIAFAMLAGTILFSMQWGRAWPMVCLVLVGWAAFTASLALVLGSVARTSGQMAGLGVLTTMLLAALGGCWWPIEIAPRWMQTLALFLPTGWAMDAMHKLINFGDAASAAVPQVGAMFAGALVLGWIGVRVFRYQ